MKLTKEARRKKIHLRVKKNIKGTETCPRISVFRSNKSIYCQLIDDLSGTTLASASSKEGSVDAKIKTDAAAQVGKLIAERAIAKNITKVKFDRSGYLYHGRVKALADSARENGLTF